ncbi:MAG: hypothetical protein MJE12_12720 [Alphaproteobacteria bacterium]|nr:hypothetical protein [Alphaproteobacteria bacterium]
MRQQCRCLVAGLVMLGAGLILHPASAAEGKSKEAVSASIAKDYGVQVLRIVEAEHDGMPIFLVTVMNPGGDSNAAFQVTTLAVERATGKLVSQYRSTPTGQVHSGAPTRIPSADGSGTVIRQNTDRRLRPR